MYPISLGFEEAESRIRLLLKNGHYAEALVTAVFTFEKTLFRALRSCIIARGFSSKHADLLLKKNSGFENLKDLWECFSKDYKTLPETVGNRWSDVVNAKGMRNKLVHGQLVYKLKDCELWAKKFWRRFPTSEKN